MEYFHTYNVRRLGGGVNACSVGCLLPYCCSLYCTVCTSALFSVFSEIWSDKVSLLHIKVTQRGGEHGDECRQSHGGANGAQSDGDVACGILITFETNALGIPPEQSLLTSSVAPCTDGASATPVIFYLTILLPLRASV